MSDGISRSQAIEALRQKCLCTKSDDGDSDVVFWDDVIESLASLPSSSDPTPDD